MQRRARLVTSIILDIKHFYSFEFYRCLKYFKWNCVFERTDVQACTCLSCQKPNKQNMVKIIMYSGVSHMPWLLKNLRSLSAIYGVYDI
jgi:hypothetical protein